jgi:hypothetical protein
LCLGLYNAEASGRGPISSLAWSSRFSPSTNGRSLALDDALIVARCEARQTLGGILLVEVM